MREVKFIPNFLGLQSLYMFYECHVSEDIINIFKVLRCLSGASHLTNIGIYSVQVFVFDGGIDSDRLDKFHAFGRVLNVHTYGKSEVT